MTKLRAGFLVLIGAGILLALVLVMRPKPQDDIKSANPVPVPVWSVTFQEQLSITSNWPATVSPRRQSKLGFERGGLIAQVFVDVGDPVHKGDTLASLNTKTQRADLIAARAAVAQAKANYDIATATAKRRQTLAKAGHISSQGLDEVLANQTAANAAYQARRASATAIEARLSLSHIIAPFDGMIIARNIDEGGIAGPAKAVLELVESGVLEIKTGLPEKTARAISQGDSVIIELPGRTMRAQLRRKTNVIDPATQTIGAIFDFTAGQDLPPAGQAVRIRLADTIEQRGFLAPLSALREGNRGLWSLYALRKDEKKGTYVLSPVPVEILYANEQNVYLRGPIKDGTLVLRAASQNTAAGMLVTPVQAASK